jgi:hypothetical protein
MAVLYLHSFAFIPNISCALMTYCALNQAQEKDLLDALAKLSEVSYDGTSLCRIF